MGHMARETLFTKATYLQDAVMADLSISFDLYCRLVIFGLVSNTVIMKKLFCPTTILYSTGLRTVQELNYSTVFLLQYVHV